MPPSRHGWANSLQNLTIHAIAARDRREALRGILNWAPISDESLAGYCAAQVSGTSSPADTHIQSVHTELFHRHLPVLSDAGLIEWDAESGTVDAATHVALSDHRFRRLLRLSSEGVDDVLDGLSHEYRRIVLTTLWEGETEQAANTLARKIARSCEREGMPETGSIDEIALSLHHIHLPKLADYDLIEYDPETSRVAYPGHPAVEKVLTIIYEPNDSLDDKLNGLLSGLKDSSQSVNSDSSNSAGWPHYWRQYDG